MRKPAPLAAIASVAAAVVLAAPSFLDTPRGELDDVTPQLVIDAVTTDPGDDTRETDTAQVRSRGLGHIARDRPIRVRVDYRDLEFRPDLATDPVEEYAVEPQVDGQGHLHVYVQRLPHDGAPKAAVESFCTFDDEHPQDFGDGTLTAVCPPVSEPGLYRLSVDFTTNAHDQRLKNGPRDFTPADVVRLWVE